MKKKVLAMFLAIIMVAGLVGCGKNQPSSDSNADSSTSKVKIQFMHMQVEQERQDVVKKIISEFESENPNIEVEPIPVNEDDYDSKITALGGSGKLPAVIELNQDQAKTYVKNQFINTKAVNEVISQKGEDKFFDGALKVIKTEDGKDYVGVPINGWVQGIWVNEAMLKEKGFTTPKTWDDVVKIAEAFYDPNNKQYGIAIPTGAVAFTEQVFSQFALSNGANVFDNDGKVTFNTPAMKEAVEFYKKLASYSMPGSTEVADVKDAFVSKHAPMALYSTYILGAVVDAGFIKDVSLVLPTKTASSAYGCIITLSISDGLTDEETEAAKKFVNFLLDDAHNIEWLLMAPGGVQPVLKSVNENKTFLENDTVKAFAHLSNDIEEAFTNLQVFGTVGDKNFMAMGDVTNKSIISKMLNNVIVQNSDIDSELAKAEAAIKEVAK